MGQKGFVPVFVIVIAAIILAIGGGVWYYSKNTVEKPKACTQEAKQCPDGSYVSRTGPTCEFAACPPTMPFPPLSIDIRCTSDYDCPSPDYLCEAQEGFGTVYPNNTASPTFQVVKGVCKKKQGICDSDSDCVSGLLCHASVCTSPIGQKCYGSDDINCPPGYQCVQSCGPPVSRPKEPPPPYFCELNEFAVRPKMCPICLASNTVIFTPNGNINIKDMRVGMSVWSLDKNKRKIVSTVISISHTPAPQSHQVIHLVLVDGREVWASPDHPTTNSSPVKQLGIGEIYDGSKIQAAELVPYWDQATYDIMPDSDTGYYWANGILLASTLARE